MGPKFCTPPSGLEISCFGLGRRTRAFQLRRFGWFFYFYIFQFCFLQKYIFVFEIYKYIPLHPCCRAAGTWSPRCGAAGGFQQFSTVKICAPAPGGPVARQWGDRSPRPPGSGAAGLVRKPATQTRTRQQQAAQHGPRPTAALLF